MRSTACGPSTAERTISSLGPSSTTSCWRESARSGALQRARRGDARSRRGRRETGAPDSDRPRPLLVRPAHSEAIELFCARSGLGPDGEIGALSQEKGEGAGYRKSAGNSLCRAGLFRPPVARRVLGFEAGFPVFTGSGGGFASLSWGERRISLVREPGLRNLQGGVLVRRARVCVRAPPHQMIS